MRILALSFALISLTACGDREPGAPEAPTLPSVDGGPAVPSAPAIGRVNTGVPPLSAADYDMRDIVELGLTGEESMRDIAHNLQIEHGAENPVEGNYSELINIVEDGANVTIVFSINGIPDDSVQAVQHVVEAFLPAGNWTPVTGYGVRQKCWRGSAAGEWTKEPCP